jgi:DNA-binding NarL/FixJ family response regulator
MGVALLLVEDHAFSRTTMAAALSLRGVRVTACATAAEAMAAARASAPDVAVLDLDLGGGPTGLDVAAALREEFPAIGLVILTGFRDPRLAARDLPALPRGAAYVCKSDVDDFGALERLLMSVHRAPLSVRSPQGAASGPTAVLTDHQVEILLAVAEGYTSAQIAAERGTTVGAVEQTIARVCERLGIPREEGLNRRAQLVQVVSQSRAGART